MKVQNGEKKMEMIIDSYEFPFDKQGLKNDNNWLNVKVLWEDEVVKEEGIVPCLLSDELKQLIEDLTVFLKDQQEFYVSAFSEENLKIKLKMHQDGFAFFISFLFKHHNEPFVLVKQMKKDEVQELINDLQEQQSRFPIR